MRPKEKATTFMACITKSIVKLSLLLLLRSLACRPRQPVIMWSTPTKDHVITPTNESDTLINSFQVPLVVWLVVTHNSS